MKRLSAAELARLNIRRPRKGTIDRTICDHWARGLTSGQIAIKMGRTRKHIDTRIWFLRNRYGAIVVPYRRVGKHHE